MGIDTRNLRLKDIEEHCRQLTTDRSRLAESYKVKEAKYSLLKKMDDSIKKFLEKSDKSHPLQNNNRNRGL